MVGKKGVHRLNEFPSYRGGHTLLNSQGYVMEFFPEHRDANSWGWVPQHRLIGEDLVGRPLVVSKDPRVQECVHHIDSDPLNNNPSNLKVMTTSQHRKLHGRTNSEKLKARVTADQAAVALEGRTIQEAARVLQVDKQTLRNRFPDLIESRKRSPPKDYRDPALAEKIRAYASDPGKYWNQCYRDLHISPQTLAKAVKHHQIEWTHVPRPGRPPRVRGDQTAPAKRQQSQP